MNIVVLNGSPKGELSLTLQYVRYLEKKFPQHDFIVLHIARDLPKIENDSKRFAAIIDRIATADAVLWSFPLYYLLVHAHYKRFIELIWERQAIATSIYFYDHSSLQSIESREPTFALPQAAQFDPPAYRRGPAPSPLMSCLVSRVN
jgi:NAD(P)H-dependent FMN reductase